MHAYRPTRRVASSQPLIHVAVENHLLALELGDLGDVAIHEEVPHPDVVHAYVYVDIYTYTHMYIEIYEYI